MTRGGGFQPTWSRLEPAQDLHRSPPPGTGPPTRYAGIRHLVSVPVTLGRGARWQTELPDAGLETDIVADGEPGRRPSRRSGPGLVTDRGAGRGPGGPGPGPGARAGPSLRRAPDHRPGRPYYLFKWPATL